MTIGERGEEEEEEKEMGEGAAESALA